MKNLFHLENEESYTLECMETAEGTCQSPLHTPGQKGKEFPDNIRQKISIRCAWLLDCDMGKCVLCGDR